MTIKKLSEEKGFVSDEIIRIACPLVLLGAIMMGSSGIFHNFTITLKNTNPDYVNPRTIEFNVKDKDLDGKKETYVKIKDQEYLLKYVNDQPQILPYPLEYKINTSTGDKK